MFLLSVCTPHHIATNNDTLKETGLTHPGLPCACTPEPVCVRALAHLLNSHMQMWNLEARGSALPDLLYSNRLHLNRMRREEKKEIAFEIQLQDWIPPHPNLPPLLFFNLDNKPISYGRTITQFTLCHLAARTRRAGTRGRFYIH